MEDKDGLTTAAVILLLVGAILSAFSALMMLLAAVGMGALMSAFGGAEGATFAILYGVLAVVMATGSVFGFLGWSKARAGDLQGAFVFGLVAALVPPLQIIPLLGAIFAKVSPDNK